MIKNNLKHIETGIRYFLTKGNNELRIGEKLVLITVIRLLAEKQVITKYDVCNANHIKRDTTYHLIQSLERKGYLVSNRSNQYFSRSYLSLKGKGLKFSSEFKKEVLSK